MRAAALRDNERVDRVRNIFGLRLFRWAAHSSGATVYAGSPGACTGVDPRINLFWLLYSLYLDVDPEVPPSTSVQGTGADRVNATRVR